MGARFGEAWNTLNPSAHGFASAEEMEGAAKAQGFDSALHLQRNRLLQQQAGKDPSQTGMGMNSNERALNTVRGMAPGTRFLSGPSGHTSTIGPNGYATNLPGMNPELAGNSRSGTPDGSPSGRILDGGKDVTSDFAAGGRYSSQKPTDMAVARKIGNVQLSADGTTDMDPALAPLDDGRPVKGKAGWIQQNPNPAPET